MKELRGYFALDEDGEWHAFEGSVGEELVSRGILVRRDGVWRIRHADRNVVEDKYPFLAVCDFCARRPVAWDIDCDDFEDTFGNHSMGGWAACDECGRLVEKGDHAGLLRRVAERYGPQSRKMFTANQALFWQHYRGIKRIPVRLFGH